MPHPVARSRADSGVAEGDGFSDVLIGAASVDLKFGGEGAACLAHGPRSGLVSLAEAELQLQGALEGIELGSSVSDGRGL